MVLDGSSNVMFIYLVTWIDYVVELIVYWIVYYCFTHVIYLFYSENVISNVGKTIDKTIHDNRGTTLWFLSMALLMGKDHGSYMLNHHVYFHLYHTGWGPQDS